MYITWGRAKQNGNDGVRVSFVFDEQYIDQYEFYDKPDIDMVMSILSKPDVVPELLLMLIRNRLDLTVH